MTTNLTELLFLGLNLLFLVPAFFLGAVALFALFLRALSLVRENSRLRRFRI